MSRQTAERAAIELRRTERVYSVLARVYDGFFDWALGPGRRRAVSCLPIAAGDRVLEIGVGTGLSLPEYPPDCSITGIDISEAMLEQASARVAAMARSDISLREMDARKLRFADSTFDHVVAPYVISVVPEPERVMEEIRRVCKPRGTVVVVNHFESSNRLLRFFERALTPLSRWIGFRMDVRRDVVTRTPGLEMEAIQRVNLFGLWHLLVLRRTADAADSPD